MAQLLTGWFIAVILLLIAVYDLTVCLVCGTDATISGVVRRANERWPLLSPLLAFAAGCLYGHFFL